MSLERAQRIQHLGYAYESQPKTRKNRCNLCGHHRSVTITHTDRYGFPAPASTCAQCGLTSLAQPMTPDAYTHFYSEVYRPLVSAYHGRLIDAKSIQGEQWSYAEEVMREIAPFWKSTYCSMLDIGGSTGVISVAMAKQFGIKATVIDPAPAETAEAEKHGIESITGFVETWDGEGRKFSVVALFQTVDHLLDARATLEKSRELLESDGLLVVDIVDFEAAIRRNRSVEAGVKIDHVFSFTQETFEALLARIGFSWIHKSFAPDHLHVLYVCERCDPNPQALPRENWVCGHFDEIRRIQNSP